MKLLVTGASGFVGRNFMERFGGDHLFCKPSSKKVDFTDPTAVDKLFAKEYCDAVLHLADTHGAKSSCECANLKMFRNIQRGVILRHVDRLVILGSGHEYGVWRDLVDVKEEEAGKEVPDDSFGIGKFLINSLASRDKVTTNLRHFLLYGKYASPYENIISRMAYYAAVGKDIVLERDRVVNLIYIDDSLQIINAALDGKLRATDYNVASPQKIKLTQIAKMFREISGNSFAVLVSEKEPDFEYTADISKLTSELPATKFTPVKKALAEVFLWVCDEFDTFLPARLGI